MKESLKSRMTGGIQIHRSRCGGTTLAEMMIGLLIFAMISVGISASLVQLRNQSESAMYQAVAQQVAEGILEQIRRADFSTNSDFSVAAATAPLDYPSSGGETTTDPVTSAVVPNYRSIAIRLIGVDSGNYATVQEFNLYWAADTSSYYEIGARSDPAVPTSTILGVVEDVDYRDALGNVIRPCRYMKMKVNLTRSLNSNKNVVQVRLRYIWGIPGRGGAGTVSYYPSSEIHAVVSKIPTY